MSPNEVLSKLQMDYELYIFFSKLKNIIHKEFIHTRRHSGAGKNVQVLILWSIWIKSCKLLMIEKTLNIF